MKNSERKHQTTRPIPKMTILQLTQKNFATIGVSPNLPLQPYPINAKIAIGFLMLASYFICYLVYWCFEATKLIEYMRSIYMASVAFVIILYVVVIILNVEEMFQLINNCENLVNTRKYTAALANFSDSTKINSFSSIEILSISTNFR